jgi:hypothetical protein
MLITLPLRSKRDVLLARQRARQIAALLHFTPHDQVCIAAGAFAVAARALRHSRSGQLRIQIDKETLQVFPTIPGQDSRAHLASKKNRSLPLEGSLRLLKRLPAPVRDFASEDLTWLIEQLDRLTGYRLFEEIDKQNQEVLALVHALKAAQARIEQLEGKQLTAFAA